MGAPGESRFRPTRCLPRWPQPSSARARSSCMARRGPARRITLAGSASGGSAAVRSRRRAQRSSEIAPPSIRRKRVFQRRRPRSGCGGSSPTRLSGAGIGWSRSGRSRIGMAGSSATTRCCSPATSSLATRRIRTSGSSPSRGSRRAFIKSATTRRSSWSGWLVCRTA